MMTRKAGPTWNTLLRRYGLLVGLAVGVNSGCVMARPARAKIGAAPASLGASTVLIASASGSLLRAWLVRGRPAHGAVLLLHGVGANRASMLARARFLHDRGYTVLAPDFQAHGESSGDHITFGARESLDAASALHFLRENAAGERVAVIGISMGGAAALLGDARNSADALVLESVYPTFEDAVADRLGVWLGPLGFLGRAIAPALIGSVAPRIGVDADALRPIARIGGFDKPLLLLTGTEDRYTPVAEARALFDCAAAPKEYWEVVGAGHEDLHDFAPTEYEQLIDGFLSSALSSDTTIDPLRTDRHIVRGLVVSGKGEWVTSGDSSAASQAHGAACR
jgi:uncharacterized protein